VLTRARLGDGVNRQRVLGFRLGLEFVRVGDRVRKGGSVWGPFVWGSLYVGAPVRPNRLNMPKSASASQH